jgi:hypothetical protein
MTTDVMETAILTKTDSCYELSDSEGDPIQVYRSWDPIAEMFRNCNYSEEYIERRKSEVDAGSSAKIDESDE